MNVNIKQSSKKDEKKENYWNWSVWIDTSREIIEKISYVEYILHSSFRNRVRKISSKSNNFKLSSKGWGEFKIYIKVFFEDNEEPILLCHDLKLFNNDENENNKTVFISSTLFDEENVEELTNALTKKKMKVKTQDMLESTSSSLDNVNESIKESDTFILYGADNLTRNQKYELDLAIEGEKEIIIKLDKEDEIDKHILDAKDLKNTNIKIFNNNNDIIENI